MPRKHLEFIQSQSLGWQSNLLPYAGVASKTLSRDDNSGARSSIVRYPAAWKQAESYCLSCDEELLVLRGSLNINGLEYKVGDYAYLPSGFPRVKAFSESGCDVLCFFESELQMSNSAPVRDLARTLIERLQTSAMDWSAATDPNVQSISVGRKLLRPDTESGERTWLLRLESDEPYSINGVERHPCAEEMFLLDGDIVMNSGVMQKGAYFWRPPHIAHGPTGSHRGFTALFRAKEGAFSTEWSDSNDEIPWSAAKVNGLDEPY